MEPARGFFAGRRQLELGRIPGVGQKKALAEYVNVPAIIGTLVSRKMATLHELGTVYGTEDAYNMLEIVTVDAYNDALLRQE